MAVLRNFFSIIVLLHHVAAMIYAQDDQSGFISIYCGSPKASNYTQDGVNYISDEYCFVDGGESHNISSIYNKGSRIPVYNTLRSFPDNKRNCYTLRPEKGRNNRYLIRAIFRYGNYDNKGQPPIFDVYIGADYWVTVNITEPGKFMAYEIIHLMTSSDYIYVCLLNTGNGNPFISALELRLLDATMYDDDESPSSLILVDRSNFGAQENVRYPNDKYDRIWHPIKMDGCRALNASVPISYGPDSDLNKVPSKVLSTAVTPTISTNAIFYKVDAANTADKFIVYIYLAKVEISESNQSRESNIYLNGNLVGQYLNEYITQFTQQTSSKKIPTIYTLKLNKTLNSTLPPILNALEIYTVKQLSQNHTEDQNVAAIWSIKSTYGLIKLNWQGDPCIPQEYVWDGVNCNYDALGAARIISLNLSSRGLSGEIATALANLTMLESLDLSYNNLTGNVPDFLTRLDNLTVLNLMGNNFTQPLPAGLLAKSKDGSLWLRTDEEGSDEDKSSCLDGSCGNNKHKIVVILAPIIGCILVLSIIVFIVKQVKKKAFIRSEEVFIPRKQQFTYSEVVHITNNFQNEIGRGGFGRVFRGSVGDNQVAVKILSQSSSQGYKEFQTEVKLLIKIHHTNITSLVGYCDDSNHKGILYDFMANGNLEKHLYVGCPNVLSWERRLQIGCDTAEGLAYLHHGCTPPIVHRDVKPSNILLNEGFHAKLADFGLSRAFPTEDATHITSLKVAGTLGYLDPEYHSTTRLTEKSDVYSFGVVLLELITSRPVIFDAINIVHWVKSQIELRNVETLIDSRLEGGFDIDTAGKVMETALACVSCPSIKRPTMNDVVMDLKNSLQAEKTRQKEAMSLNLETMSDLMNPR